MIPRKQDFQRASLPHVTTGAKAKSCRLHFSAAWSMVATYGAGGTDAAPLPASAPSFRGGAGRPRVSHAAAAPRRLSSEGDSTELSTAGCTPQGWLGTRRQAPPAGSARRVVPLARRAKASPSLSTSPCDQSSDTGSPPHNSAQSYSKRDKSGQTHPKCVTTRPNLPWHPHWHPQHAIFGERE